eukprot:TRINITY_DN66886_c0_g1_i2.p1 TRINITY_DN66886_c0_g1~~TRINITY_DN66886_c0_g1_i2.p1  ORF type:complete len:353 (+),score=25.57 TRINITY_DN66886_c0_g1_i2:34-1059(+)
MDPNQLTLDQLISLKSAVPSQKECRELNDYLNGKHPDYPGIKDVDLLGPVEKYFLQVKDIPRLEQRIECFIFARSYDEVQTQVREQLNLVDSALESVFLCNDLVIFLQTVLTVGNILNAGSVKGGATGFKLSNLPMLYNIRNNDKNNTLLSFCISQGLRRSKSLGTLAMQLWELNQAAEVQMPLVEALLDEIREGFDRIKCELSEVDVQFPTNVKQLQPRYARVLRQFQETRYQDYESIQNEFEQVIQNLEELSQYFDEVHDPADHMRVLKILKGFLELYEITIKQMFKSSHLKHEDDTLKHYNSEHIRSAPRRSQTKILSRCQTTPENQSFFDTEMNIPY